MSDSTNSKNPKNSFEYWAKNSSHFTAIFVFLSSIGYAGFNMGSTKTEVDFTAQLNNQKIDCAEKITNLKLLNNTTSTKLLITSNDLDNLREDYRRLTIAHNKLITD